MEKMHWVQKCFLRSRLRFAQEILDWKRRIASNRTFSQEMFMPIHPISHEAVGAGIQALRRGIDAQFSNGYADIVRMEKALHLHLIFLKAFHPFLLRYPKEIRTIPSMFRLASKRMQRSMVVRFYRLRIFSLTAGSTMFAWSMLRTRNGDRIKSNVCAFLAYDIAFCINWS